MVVYRMSDSTSLLPNNLLMFVDNCEIVPCVATKNAVLIGENHRIKIESG